MKYISIICLTICLLVSCRPEVQETSEVKKDKNHLGLVRKDTILFEFKLQWEWARKERYESELTNRLKELSKLDNNYQFLKVEYLNPDFAILYNGLLELPKMEFGGKHIEIKNLDRFEIQNKKMKYALIKGTKNLGDNFFARAKIEEYIFNSNECAEHLVNFIHKLKDNGNLWEDIDKSPNSIFSEENKVYYISTGGWYMNSFYEEIEINMKK